MDVFVVEDDPLVRETVACSLEDLGLEVATTPAAEPAIEVAAMTGPPTVLVTDIDLGPGMDGVALAAIFAVRWPEVPVVFMTGRDDRHLNGHRLGPRQCLVPKPFSLAALAGIVLGFVERRQPGADSRLPPAVNKKVLRSPAGQRGHATATGHQADLHSPPVAPAGSLGHSPGGASSVCRVEADASPGARRADDARVEARRARHMSTIPPKVPTASMNQK